MEWLDFIFPVIYYIPGVNTTNYYLVHFANWKTGNQLSYFE